MTAPIDPVAAALDAIAAYFQGAVAGLVARRGWPEATQDLDLATSPVATLTETGPGEYDWCSPKLIDSSTTDGQVLGTYRVAWLEVEAQLDLWCAYRHTRDDMIAAMMAVFNNGLPTRSGLWVTSTGYFSRPLTVDISDGPVQDLGDTAPRGEWRKTWNLKIRTDLVAQATSPALARLALRLSTRLAGITITEPDRLVPPE